MSGAFQLPLPPDPSGASEPAHSEQRPTLSALLAQRYAEPSEPAAPAELGLESASALQVLLSHRSVRRYLPDALPSGTLELLLAAAQSASSSSNLQLWSVIDVQDPARRRALYEVAGKQAHVLESPAFLVWVADLHRPTRLAAARGPGHAGLSYLEMFLMASIDTALAAQNAVVAAEALGLGVVYIGALRNDAQRVAEVMQLPERSYAVFGLCVGWPHPEAEGAVKPRLPRDVVLHRDAYGNVGEQLPQIDD